MNQQDLEQLFQQDPADVQVAIAQMTQHECLVAADLLMARRGHNSVDRRWRVPIWRQERTAWRVAQDTKRDRKEAEE